MERKNLFSNTKPKPVRSVPIALICNLICLIALIAISSPAYTFQGDILAGGGSYDWPTYMSDSQRSGITGDSIKTPLSEEWVYVSSHKPQPAWPSEQVEDASHGHFNLEPQVGYDRAYQMAISTGHGFEYQLYFVSSADHKVHCLDMGTGEERWSFFTGGPVRFGPYVKLGSVSDGRLYVGSDDGWLYCLSTIDGSVVWKFKDPKSNRYLIGNGNVISSRPVRTGVALYDGTVYFAAGMFPQEGVKLYALDALDGSIQWETRDEPFLQALTPQGYILVSQRHVYVPCGRAPPVVFDRKTGKFLGVPKGGRGGTYFALVTPEEDVFMYGSGLRYYCYTDNIPWEYDKKTPDGIPEIRGYDVNEWDPDRPPKRRHYDEEEGFETIVNFNGLRLIIKGNIGYLQTREELIAFDRSLREKLAKEKKPIDEAIKWRVPCAYPYSLILARNGLAAGGDNEVAVFDLKTGKIKSTAKVTGKAYGLAAAKGKLFVSTDQGTIHCLTKEGRNHRVEPSSDPSPYPADNLTAIYTSAAKRIVDETGIKKGYCLVIGNGEGRLAYELAKLTDLKILGIEEDQRKVDVARKALDKAGFYGVRVTVHHGSVSDASYPEYFANLIVSDHMVISGKIPCPGAHMYRLLRPSGGVAYFGQAKASADYEAALKKWLTEASIEGWKITKNKDGLWAVVNRGHLPGSGEWTHTYADVGNTACSGDQLSTGEKPQIAWFGEPGPVYMIDRHARPHPSLFKDGRMFVKGRDRIITVDAYNGTVLWEKVIPNFSRSGANIDPGPMVVSEDYLYAAVEDKCLVFDVATGKNVITFKVPELAKGEAHEWGYVASVDNLLFGSGQKPGASLNPYKGSKYEEYGVIHNIDVDHLCMVETKSVVASNFLFALDRHSGKELWVYNSGGVIPNIGIAVGDGRIYFLENTDPKALAEDKGGRVPLKAMTKSSLVALDIKTGKKIWSKEVDLSKAHFILFVSHANGTLLLTYSSRGDPPGFPEYYLDAFDAGSGKAKWSTHYAEITSDIPDERSKDGYDSGLRTLPLKKRTKAVQSGRGKETHHPVIIGNRIISEPLEFDLQTGKRGELKLIRSGRGCGTISASSKSIFFRAATLATYDLDTGKNYRISNTAKPGCWLNVLPVGGLILMPEATSGCICNYPVQATFAYIPR